MYENIKTHLYKLYHHVLPACFVYTLVNPLRSGWRSILWSITISTHPGAPYSTLKPLIGWKSRSRWHGTGWRPVTGKYDKSIFVGDVHMVVAVVLTLMNDCPHFKWSFFSVWIPSLGLLTIPEKSNKSSIPLYQPFRITWDYLCQRASSLSLYYVHLGPHRFLQLTENTWKTTPIFSGSWYW